MKIRIAFAAIALVAIASAFTTRTKTTLHYRFLGDGGSLGWKVEETPRVQGSQSGNYNCSGTSNSCVVDADDAVAIPQENPVGSGNFYLPKAQSTVIMGTYSQIP